MSEGTALLALVGLGAFHGVNPGMGWLFAVSLGLQERSRAAVLRALPPIAAGHALAVVVALLLLRGLQVAVPPAVVAMVTAAVLVGFGIWRLVSRRHPRWVGMRVNRRDLVLWSFLMATAHGAGLMLLPVLLRTVDDVGLDHVTGLVSASVAGSGLGLAAVAVHSAAMLAMMAAVALLVYEQFGVAILRRAWINLDLLWGVALITAGLFALFT